MKTWMDKVKKYFAENATVFADGMAMMNGSTLTATLYTVTANKEQGAANEKVQK